MVFYDWKPSVLWFLPRYSAPGIPGWPFESVSYNPDSEFQIGSLLLIFDADLLEVVGTSLGLY